MLCVNVHLCVYVCAFLLHLLQGCVVCFPTSMTKHMYVYVLAYVVVDPSNVYNTSNNPKG